MEINLLSKLIRESLFDQEKVVIPGLGYFYTEQIPATFSEDGKSILPPYFKVSFAHDEKIYDGHLETLYINKANSKPEEALIEWNNLISEFKESLIKEGKIAIPHIGELILDQQGKVILEIAQHRELSSAVYGFEQIPVKPMTNYIPTIEISHNLDIESVIAIEEELQTEAGKNHQQEPPLQNSQLADSNDINRQDLPTTHNPDHEQVEKQSQESVQEQAEESAQEQVQESAHTKDQPENTYITEQTDKIETDDSTNNETDKIENDTSTEETANVKRSHLLRNTIIIIAATLIVVIAAIIILGLTGMLDTILYTPEELELINRYGN
ncbi:MAG: hypothetical protein IKC17_03780 [Bacteroidales bacterium]|nr:hypothetical protein [Bacteroidales bacterium]